MFIVYSPNERAQGKQVATALALDNGAVCAERLLLGLDA
jgi:hypothetical protein